MTQTPNPQRRRRTERYPEQEPVPAVRTPAQARMQGKPADLAPAEHTRTPRTRQPIGRSAQLQARTRRQAEEAAQAAQAAREAYMARNARSSRTAPPAWGEQESRSVPAYSDFAPNAHAPQNVRMPNRKRRKNSHTGLWLAVSLICLMAAGTLILFALPQITDMETDLLPGTAFVNGSIVTLDQTRIDQLHAAHQAVMEPTIRYGVYIDGLSVGGMTREEAVEAVAGVPGGEGSSFNVRIAVGDQELSVNSGEIPTYRDIHEVVTRAWAVGRSGSSVRFATGTPLSQRWQELQTVAHAPVMLYTGTTYDRTAVRAKVDEFVSGVNREPVDATIRYFDPNSKTFTFNPDESGVMVDADLIYQEVIARLDSGDFYSAFRVEPQVVLASVRRADLVAGFGLVSSYTTNKTGSTNRTTNIALSAEAINGKTILPGEEFSFNLATGERTKAKGYKTAAAISGGELYDDYGGGVCQTSTTLYNAAIRANLTIVSRSPHAWPSNYVEEGEDAAVNWPNLDLKLRNDSEWPVFIVASCNKDKKTVTVEIYGKSLGDGITIDLDSKRTYKKEPPDMPLYKYNPNLAYGTEKQTVKPRTGYAYQTEKVWYQNGVEIKREGSKSDKFFVSNYPMYQETIEHNKPNVYGTQ